MQVNLAGRRSRSQRHRRYSSLADYERGPSTWPLAPKRLGAGTQPDWGVRTTLTRLSRPFAPNRVRFRPVATFVVPGRGDQHRHQQAQGIDQQMPLAALGFLASVVTSLLPAHLGRLHRLAVDTHRAGRGFSLSWVRTWTHNASTNLAHHQLTYANAILLEGVGNRAVRNLIVMCADVRSGNWQVDSAENWVTDRDPGFVDASKGDFRLRPDGEVFVKLPGFQAIPSEKISLYADELRPRPPVETWSYGPPKPHQPLSKEALVRHGIRGRRGRHFRPASQHGLGPPIAPHSHCVGVESTAAIPVTSGD